jgi:hypothetical protein
MHRWNLATGRRTDSSEEAQACWHTVEGVILGLLLALLVHM